MRSTISFTPYDLPTFVEGRFLDSQAAERVDVLNPSNGQVCSTISAGCEADVDRAVRSARDAFEDGRWSEMSPTYRKKALLRFAEMISENCVELDRIDAEEMGKPVTVTLANAANAADLMRFFAEAADKITGDVYLSDRGSYVTQRRVPRGVVAAVVPWNFPTHVSVLKIAPALAAGNSVVLKPSELSSRSAMRLARLAMEAGLPPGVLNIVPGLGTTVGKALGLHRDVDMLTFTGSTEVGKLMLTYSGRSNMKVVMAECGGKSPQIVFADGVDLDAAADTIAGFLLTNQGQICSVGSRLLVQRTIEKRIVERVAEKFKGIRMGEALDPQTTFGPLVSSAQRDRVMRYIETAIADGAELVTGGRVGMPETGGYFVEPTLLRNVSPTDRIAQEEVFGPVLCVVPFEDEEDAIRIANGTMYGLLAYVWTSKLETGMRMAKRIRSSVRINAVPPRGEGAAFATSFEPFGESGMGVEGGIAGLESYLRRQRLWFNHA